MQEPQVSSLSWEAPLEKEMETHYTTLGLENSMDRGAWQATCSPQGHKESDHVALLSYSSFEKSHRI